MSFKRKFASSMLGLLLCLLVFLPAFASDTGVDSPVRDKWALIIGISEFKNPRINLKYPAKDARDFSRFLTEKANFAPDHIKLLTNEKATRANILDYLADKWLPRVAMPDDLVVIFISSHGSPSHADVAGANYLVAHDTDPERLFATGLAMKELASIVKERVHSDRVVLFLDACHSGAAKTGGKGIFRKSNFDAENLMQGTGQLVVCSSRSNQISWESKKYANGVFTRQLINSLSAGSAKPVLLGEAFETLKERVQTEVLADRGELQTPVLKSTWKGSGLSLSCKPFKPRRVPDFKWDRGESEVKVDSKPVAKVTEKVLSPEAKRLEQEAKSAMAKRNYRKATRLYEKLRKLIESEIGRDTKFTTECLTQLGWLYSVMGRHEDAASLQRESIRINTTLYGPNSFFVARETTLLCNTLLAKRDFVDAEPVAIKAIETWENYGGKNTPYVLESLVNMAEIKEHFGEYPQAQRLLERAQKNANAQHLAKNNPHRLKLNSRIESLRLARERH